MYCLYFYFEHIVYQVALRRMHCLKSYREGSAVFLLYVASVIYKTLILALMSVD